MRRLRYFFTFFTVVAVCIIEVSVSTAEAEWEYAGRGGGPAIHSVYRILCPDQDRSGTGFGHKSGRIITAEHIVHGCNVTQLLVSDPSGEKTAVTAVVSDIDLDIAILTPSVKDFVKSPFTLTSEDSFMIGAQVSTWGYPEGYFDAQPLLSVGYLAGVSKINTGSGMFLRKWIVNGAINLGNSGGPVIETKNATVIGVITSKHAPIKKGLEAELLRIKEKGSAEGQVLAKLIQHLRSQTQLVIGYATMTPDLRNFLKAHNIEP